MKRGNALALLLSLAIGGEWSSRSAGDEFPPVDQLAAEAGFPNPLVSFREAKPVASAEEWRESRRPELLALFQHYMYGKLPPPTESVAAKVTRSEPNFLDGKATLEEIELTLRVEANQTYKRRIHLLTIIPNRRNGPAPVFVAMNFCGNHTVVDEPRVRLPEEWVYASCAGAAENRSTEAGRGGQKDVWNVDLIVDRGYALAAFYSGDIDPDTPDFADGLNGERFDLSRPIAPDAAGTIACWAWGYHRVADYLVTDQRFDAARMATVGHSRNGKTALLAAATDERFALAIPHQAGCGGTAPSRGRTGESVQRINTSFPHWFCDRFNDFNERPERLPFDQHCLVALCAPRPVLFTNALDDQWANPSGQFEVLKAATPVYEFLGVDGLADDVEPPLGKLSAGRLGYFIREGKHSMTREDWAVFLDYADIWIKPRPSDSP